MLPLSFDKETVMVHMGPTGKIVKSLSGVALKDCAQIVLVIDPRKSPVPYIGFCNNELKDAVDGLDADAVRAKVFVAVLMPTASSSKECFLGAELGVLGAAIANYAPENSTNMLVRLDDYLAHGDGIISAMIAANKTIYPVEEGANFYAMFKNVMEYTYSKRAGVHWLVGDGMEEGDFSVMIEKYDEKFCTDEAMGLARIKEVPEEDFLATAAIAATSEPSFLYAFNADTTAAMTAAGIDGVNTIKYNMIDRKIIPAEHPGFKAGTSSSVQLVVASEAITGACGCGKLSLGPYTGETEYGMPSCVMEEGCKREGDDKDVLEGEDVAHCPDCSYTVCKHCYTDFAEEGALEAAQKNMLKEPEVGEPTYTGENAFFFIDADKDLEYNKDDGDLPSSIGFMTNFRELAPTAIQTVFVMADSFDSLAANKLMALSVSPMVENCDLVIFCLKTDTAQMKDFISGAKFSGENVPLLVSKNCIPFPRMHFLCFGNCMDTEVDDYSILGSSVTISEKPNACVLESSKYCTQLENPHTKTTYSLFTLTDVDKKSVNIRYIPGAPGSNVTVMNNSSFIQKLGKSLHNNDDDESCEKIRAHFVELGYSFEEYFVEEQMSNLGDMCCEYGQYVGTLTAKPDEDDED